jgi:hypothetical protein
VSFALDAERGIVAGQIGKIPAPAATQVLLV